MDRLGNAMVECNGTIYRAPAASAYSQCVADAPCNTDCVRAMPRLPPLRAHHEYRLACERFSARCGKDPSVCWQLMQLMSQLQEPVMMGAIGCFDNPCAPGDSTCDPCSGKKCATRPPNDADAMYAECVRRKM